MESGVDTKIIHADMTPLIRFLGTHVIKSFKDCMKEKLGYGLKMETNEFAIYGKRWRAWRECASEFWNEVARYDFNYERISSEWLQIGMVMSKHSV